MSGIEEAAAAVWPTWGLLPKRETGATGFLKAHPTADGRGRLIAVLDSGVDPAATGLRTTSDGRTKVVERFDCSGCGDVDTSTAATLQDGCITGLTTRELKVPSTWVNPSGEWRIGVLHPYILYPSNLTERVKEHRKETIWDPKHKLALAAANRELQEFEATHVSSTLTPEDRLLKEELETQIEILTQLEKKFNDVGPTYDCVLFNDGNVWRACIDTSEEGNLAEGVLLGEYSKTHEHAHLTPVDMMTVSINVHNNGNILEIVGMCSSHGTHVASIISAYYDDESEQNGIAPGAQIVSLGIGDSRLGSMETGTALARACMKIMELSATRKIDVINMSYGEHAHWSDSGRLGELMSEVIDKYGVVWIVSAGNHGPGLSTVGAPPDISQANMIGVGAYVSPNMMVAAHSLRPKQDGTAYSWSSRGPCINGAKGVSICAPGGAITCVPNFTLRGTQLMNGTSMAAPQVAGAVGLLISGLEEMKLPYSPYSIKRALENTARFMPEVDPFAQGSGLINIEAAFKWLCNYSDVPERDVRFNLSCGKSNQKGIYMRKGIFDRTREIPVCVEPFFATDFKTPKGLHNTQSKIDFNLKLAFVCDASWVKPPQYLDMMNVARSFPVKIEPETLPSGVHTTTIKAYDVKCPARGPVFEIPVTVVQPIPIVQNYTGGAYFTVERCLFTPQLIKRHFVMVPDFATWAVLKMQALDKNSKFMIHCIQLIPRMNCKTCEFQTIVSVSHQSENTLPFQVKGGYILEVAVTKYWASLDPVTVNYNLEFHGICPESSPIVFHGAEGVHSVQLQLLRREECLPQASLKHITQTIRASESKLSPLTERDVIPPGRQVYEMINTYNFTVVKSTEITPNIPMLSDKLYESEFESQLWMLFDSNKQFIASGDAYPSKYTLKVDKGDYVLKLSIRHERKDLLEKLADTPLLVSHKLPQALSLDIYSSQSQAFTGKKMLTVIKPAGSKFPIYLSPLSCEKLGKNTIVGQFMTGTITFAKDDLGKKVDVHCLKYFIPEQAKKSGNGSPGKDKDKGKPEEYSEVMRDLKTFWVSKLEGEAALKVYNELVQEYPDYLVSHTAYMTSLDSTSDPRKLPTPHPTVDTPKAVCEKIISISDKVISAINQEKLLAYFGLRNDVRSDASKIKTQQEKLRSYLLEALNKRGIAQCKLHFLSVTANEDTKSIMDSIKETVSDILKFTDLTDSKVVHFALWHSTVMEHYGRAVKFLNKISEEHSSMEIEERLISYYIALFWDHAAAFSLSTLPRRFPTAYKTF